MRSLPLFLLCDLNVSRIQSGGRGAFGREQPPRPTRSVGAVSARPTSYGRDAQVSDIGIVTTENTSSPRATLVEDESGPERNMGHQGRPCSPPAGKTVIMPVVVCGPGPQRALAPNS